MLLKHPSGLLQNMCFAALDAASEPNPLCREVAWTFCPSPPPLVITSSACPDIPFFAKLSCLYDHSLKATITAIAFAQRTPPDQSLTTTSITTVHPSSTSITTVYLSSHVIAHTASTRMNTTCSKVLHPSSSPSSIHFPLPSLHLYMFKAKGFYRSDALSHSK